LDQMHVQGPELLFRAAVSAHHCELNECQARMEHGRTDFLAALGTAAPLGCSEETKSSSGLYTLRRPEHGRRAALSGAVARSQVRRGSCEKGSAAAARAQEALLARRLALAAKIWNRQRSCGKDSVPKNKSQGRDTGQKFSNTPQMRCISQPARQVECSSPVRFNQPAVSNIGAEILQRDLTDCPTLPVLPHRQTRAKCTLLGNTVGPREEKALLLDGCSKIHGAIEIPDQSAGAIHHSCPPDLCRL